MSYRYGAARVVGAYYFDGAGGAVPGVLSGTVALGSVVASGSFTGFVPPSVPGSLAGSIRQSTGMTRPANRQTGARSFRN